MAKRTYKGCVYRATLIRTGKSYIGKSLAGMKSRRTVHYAHARKGLQTPFAHALNAYIEDAFEWVELFCSDDDGLLKAVEIEQIAMHRAAGVDLYNISAGGDGYYGAKWTDERRERQRRTTAERKALGLTKMTQAQKDKLSAAAIGRNAPVLTAESRNKISQAKKAYWASIPADDPRKRRLAQIGILGGEAKRLKAQKP